MSDSFEIRAVICQECLRGVSKILKEISEKGFDETAILIRIPESEAVIDIKAND